VLKNLSIFNFKKWPKSFLLSLGVILCVEWAVYKHDIFLYPVPSENLRMNLKNKISQSEEREFDILILGDCFNIMAYDPNLIEEDLNFTVFNFSTFVGQTIMASFLMLHNYIKFHENPPQLVVLGYIPSLLAIDKAFIQDSHMMHLYDFQTGNIRALSREFGMAQGFKFMIPSLKHQEYFKLMKQWPNKRRTNEFINSFYKNKGYYPWRADEMINVNFPDQTNMEGQVFQLSFFAQNYLKKILDLTITHNIPVLYVVPPDLPEDENTSNWEKRRKSSILQIYLLKKSYHNLMVRDPQHIIKSEHFIDRTHLNKKGTEVMSKYLAKEINQVIKN